MGRIRMALAAGAVAMGAAAAWGFGGGKTDSWHGRVTPDAASHAGLEYALNDPTIGNATAARIETWFNELVDFGAHIDADLGNGWDVHVHLNFEPIPEALRIGDIEAHVHVGYDGIPIAMLSILDPAPIDDMEIPGGGPDVTSMNEYLAVLTAYADPAVAGLLEQRFGEALELYGTRSLTVLDEGTLWVIDVDCSFRKPNGKNPPPGKREVWARVMYDDTIGFPWVDSVWTE